MAVPAIDVIVYPPGPSQAERQLQYLELAPANDAAAPVCPLPLQIWIRNKQGSSLHLEKVAASFADPAFNKTIPIGLDIAAGAKAAWYASNAQYIFLPSPPPSPFTITLYFTGFDPWSDAVHFVPFPLSYRFPGNDVDLGTDEFWVGKGAAHPGGGDQIFHYDLGMMGWHAQEKGWRDYFSGTTGANNADYHIWGRPVHALADGVVTFYQNHVPANPQPGTVSPEGNAKGYGNAFNIQHGGYLATYMHMQMGTLNPALTVGPEDVQFANGPTVKAGQFLGLAGNAGTSSAPHLHVGLVLRDADMRQFSIPLAFSGIHVVQDSLLNHADVPSSPWVDAVNQGLPWVPDPAIRDAVSLAPVRMTRPIDEVAIDPLALVLKGDVYVRLTLPDPPPIDVWTAQVHAQINAMGPAERRRALERARRLQEYVQILERELNARR